MKRGYKETEIGEIPEEWEVKTLETVTDIIMGQSPKSTDCNVDGCGIPFYQGNADFGLLHPTPKAWIEYPLKKAPKNSLLLSVRAPVGAINIADCESSIGRGLAAIVPKKSDLFFLYYTIQNQVSYFQKMSQGSTFDAINRDQLDDLLLSFPPLPEQKKIAEVLSSVDESIRATQAVIEQAKVLKQGMLNQLLTKGIGHKKFKQTEIGEIPEEWEVKTLGDVVDISSGYSPSLYDISEEGDIPFVKVEDMNNCEKYQESSRYYAGQEDNTISSGSVIFPKRGAAILNNKVRIASTDIYIDTNIMALQPKAAIESEYLLYEILETGLYRIADTSSIPQINNKHIIPYKISLPPLPEQKKIAEVLSSFDEMIGQSKNHIENLQRLKSGLMQDLLTGKKRVKV